MKKLLNNALCDIQQSIEVYESRRDELKRSDLNSWKFWVRWRAVPEFRYVVRVIDLLYAQKVRILHLMDKYETDPIS